MRLWFLCCVFLFVAAQLYDWLSHQAWIMADLSMPWVILGGIGLAIASNRSHLKPITSKPVAGSSPPPPIPQTSEGIPHSVVSEEKGAIASPAPSAQLNQESISFKISKPANTPPSK